MADLFFKILVQVNELIDKANAQWEERNTQALERGEEALPAMLPLVRLKVSLP